MKITVKDLEFSYNSHPVLERIGFDLEPGRILGVIGPNGSGKSTLIKCLNRLLTPRKGSVTAGGREFAALSRRELAKSISYLPQETTPGLPASVFETVLMGRRPHASWRTSRADAEKALKALLRLDLLEFADREFQALSGGEQQRVLLARALAQEARLLLLDEPTSSLDIRRQIQVMETVRDLAVSTGLTVIMVVHDLNLAARYTDNLLILSNGKIHSHGPSEKVLTPQAIAEVYGVKVKVFTDQGRPYIAAAGLAES